MNVKNNFNEFDSLIGFEFKLSIHESLLDKNNSSSDHKTINALWEKKNDYYVIKIIFTDGLICSYGSFLVANLHDKKQIENCDFQFNSYPSIKCIDECKLKTYSGYDVLSVFGFDHMYGEKDDTKIQIKKLRHIGKGINNLIKEFKPAQSILDREKKEKNKDQLHSLIRKLEDLNFNIKERRSSSVKLFIFFLIGIIATYHFGTEKLLILVSLYSILSYQKHLIDDEKTEFKEDELKSNIEKLRNEIYGNHWATYALPLWFKTDLKEVLDNIQTKLPNNDEFLFCFNPKSHEIISTEKMKVWEGPVLAISNYLYEDLITLGLYENLDYDWDIESFSLDSPIIEKPFNIKAFTKYVNQPKSFVGN